MKIGRNSLPWLVTWMASLGQFSLSLYIPAFPAISQDLQLDPEAVKSTITAFLLGFGVSQLFYGPISDKYGRKPPLLFGIALYSLACLANVFVTSLIPFLLLRFIQGMGAGSTVTIGRSILVDRFSGAELSSAASHLSMGFALGLGVSPVIGAYLQTFFGWQGDFFFLFLLGVALFIILAFCLPETSSKPLAKATWKETAHHTLERYNQILKDFTFFKFVLGGVFAYSVVIAWNVLTPFLFQTHFGYSANVYGWMSLLVAAAYFLAAHFNRSLVHKFHVGKIFLGGALLIGLSGLAILVFPTQLPLIPMIIAFYGQSLIFSNTIASAMHNYSHIAGKASAMFSSLQMFFVSIISFIMAFIPDQTLSLGLVLLALCLSIFLCLRKTMKRI